MHPTTSDNPNRMENYVVHAGEYDFSSLCFPVPLSSIASFATKNNLSIKVYGVEDEKKVIYPLRVTESVVADSHVDLLLHERNGVQHYSTIKNFSRLVSGHLNNHNGATYCCKKCSYADSTKELLAAYDVDCCHVQCTKFPKDARCRFTNIQKQLPAPFVVYADFEFILKPINEEVVVAQGVDTGTESSTTVFQEHVPCSFAYKIVSIVDPDFSRPLVMHCGEDAAERFVVRDWQQEAKQVPEKYLTTPNPMMFSMTDSISFTNATTSHMHKAT